jgi:hypothetical protein
VPANLGCRHRENEQEESSEMSSRHKPPFDFSETSRESQARRVHRLTDDRPTNNEKEVEHTCRLYEILDTSNLPKVLLAA